MQYVRVKERTRARARICGCMCVFILFSFPLALQRFQSHAHENCNCTNSATNPKGLFFLLHRRHFVVILAQVPRSQKFALLDLLYMQKRKARKMSVNSRKRKNKQTNTSLLLCTNATNKTLNEKKKEIESNKRLDLFLLWFIYRPEQLLYFMVSLGWFFGENWHYFLCTRLIWRCRCTFNRNAFKQHSHWNCLSFECVFKWFSRFCLYMKFFEHISHTNSRSKCDFICVLKRLLIDVL